MVSRYAFGAGVVAVTVLSVLPGKEVPSPGISDKIDVVAYAAPGPSGGLAFPTRRGALLLLVLLPLMGIGTGDRPVGSAATIVGHRRRPGRFGWRLLDAAPRRLCPLRPVRNTVRVAVSLE
jgi:hypothetical protein